MGNSAWAAKPSSTILITARLIDATTVKHIFENEILPLLERLLLLEYQKTAYHHKPCKFCISCQCSGGRCQAELLPVPLPSCLRCSDRWLCSS